MTVAFAPRGLDKSAQLRNDPDGHAGLALLKRTPRKRVSIAIAHQLCRYAKEVDSPLLKSYRNSIVCTQQVKQEDGRLTTRFCGNRWCLVCGSIRTARAFLGYGPTVDEWVSRRKAYFVTLTIPNVEGPALDAAVDGMFDTAKLAKDRMRKVDGVKLRALRKFECTFNVLRGDFHPHFHYVVYGRRAARLLMGEWLARYPEAKEIAQDIRKADRGSVAEMFKYFTKIITKSKKRRGLVPPAALDTMFRMMKGRRVYQPVGVKRMKPDDESKLILDKGTLATGHRAKESITWEWSSKLHDWVDFDTGDCLTGWEPGKGFADFLEHID